MPTYYAPNLANRITNVFYILGDGLPRENYTSIDVYNYTRTGSNWSTIRGTSGASSGLNGVAIANVLISGNYTLTRTGVQFSTAWGVVPVGMKISFILNTFTLPVGGFLKIQAFKGTSTVLTGDPNEYSIPLNEGLIPYSNELEINGISEESTSPVLYFNQTAIDDFLANPDQNLFILGEYDYNNIAPTDRYAVSDFTIGTVELTGQT